MAIGFKVRGFRITEVAPNSRMYKRLAWHDGEKLYCARNRKDKIVGNREFIEKTIHRIEEA